MKTLTNKQLNLFVICGKQYLNTAPAKTKLWYAVDKILKKSLKKLEEVDEIKNEKRRDHALTTDKGVFDTNENGTFKYTLAGNKKLMSELTEIENKEVEIDTHIVTEYDDDPKILSFDIRRAFEGIVIPEIDYDKLNIDTI